MERLHVSAFLSLVSHTHTSGWVQICRSEVCHSWYVPWRRMEEYFSMRGCRPCSMPFVVVEAMQPMLQARMDPKRTDAEASEEAWLQCLLQPQGWGTEVPSLPT